MSNSIDFKFIDSNAIEAHPYSDRRVNELGVKIDALHPLENS